MTTDYLKETAKEYIEKYPVRLSQFLTEYEAEEIDFIDREIEYFENTINDIINCISSSYGFCITGVDNFLIAESVCNEIGFEKFKYSTQKKIKFLENKKIPLSQFSEIPINEKEGFVFENNFDKTPPNEVYKHFNKGLVEKGYLSEQEFRKYLKLAFELQTKPETPFKIIDAPTKATIEAIFYKYYKNVAGKIHGKQRQYAALLGDYFQGYKTENVSSNFNKS